jgi:hypothetical protein
MDHKFFSLKQNSLFDKNNFYLYSFMLIFFILCTFTSFEFVDPALAQMNLDTFSAKGIINIPISQTPLVNDETTNNTEVVSDTLTNSNKLRTSDTSNSLPFLRGQWAFEVHKGEVKFFRVLFTLIQNEKIVNAFAIFNLTNTKYIQLNDKGTEIISGTVDFTSVGLKNDTIFDIPATITITGLTQLRIMLDETNTKPFFTDPIIGETRYLVDGSGNIIIQPAPTQRNPSAPIPQENSLYGSNYFF